MPTSGIDQDVSAPLAEVGPAARRAVQQPGDVHMKNLLILAALAAAPMAAHAEPAPPQQVHISSQGLDLTNPADAAVMVRRIESAVRTMCVAPGFAAGRTTAGCVRDVTRDAVRNLRIPELSTAFQRRSVPVAQG